MQLLLMMILLLLLVVLQLLLMILLLVLMILQRLLMILQLFPMYISTIQTTPITQLPQLNYHQHPLPTRPINTAHTRVAAPPDTAPVPLQSVLPQHIAYSAAH